MYFIHKFFCSPVHTLERFELMKPGAHLAGSGAGSGASVPQGSLKNVDRVRNVFPETWLWSSYNAGYISQGTYQFASHYLPQIPATCILATR